MRARMQHPKAAYGRPDCGTRYAYALGCRCAACGGVNQRYQKRYRKIHRPIARMPWPIKQCASPIEDSVERMKRLVMPYTLVPVEAHFAPPHIAGTGVASLR